MWGNVIFQLLFFLPFYDSKTVECIKFDIMHNGSSVGEFMASKTTEGERTTFVNTTNIKTKIINEIQVDFNIQSTFKDCELEYSSVEIMVNGKPYSQSTTKKVGNKYHFYKDGKLKTILTGPINYTATMMIFSEPNGIARAYSEESGSFHIIKAVANVYEKSNARGKKSIYHYQNQSLKSMDVDIGLIKIEMVLKN